MAHRLVGVGRVIAAWSLNSLKVRTLPLDRKNCGTLLATPDNLYAYMCIPYPYMYIMCIGCVYMWISWTFLWIICLCVHHVYMCIVCVCVMGTCVGAYVCTCLRPYMCIVYVYMYVFVYRWMGVRFFAVVFHPSNISGHIRTGTDLWQCALMVPL